MNGKLRSLHKLIRKRTGDRIKSTGKKGKIWLSYEIIGKKIEFEISSEYQVKGNKGCVFRHL